MPSASLIIVGTEHLHGAIVDTNSVHITRELALSGIEVLGKVVVSDTPEAIEAALSMHSEADLIITIAGLGPTRDDLTRETLADTLKLKLILHEPTWQSIQNRFRERGKNTPANNKRQAYVFPDGEVFANPHGTAPGLAIRKQDKVYICLPGPPRELLPMWQDSVVPFLQSCYSLTPPFHRSLYVFGTSESHLASIVDPMFSEDSDYSYGMYAKLYEIRIQVYSKNKSPKDLEKRYLKLKKSLNCFLISEDLSLPAFLGDQLRSRQETLATAESLTAGQIATRLVSVPGASQWFQGSVIAYANTVKTQVLQVPESLLAEQGAVSPEVAKIMAENCARHLNATGSIAVTGIAGPEGGTAEKPVGLVYAALHYRDQTSIRKYLFKGDRSNIQDRTVNQVCYDFLSLMIETHTPHQG